MKIDNVSGNASAVKADSSTALVRKVDIKEEKSENVEAQKNITEIEACRVSKKLQPIEQQSDLQDGDMAKDGHASEKRIRDAVLLANQKIRKGTSLEFSFHEETKRVSIQIVDKETKELIREIPPEKTLDMLQKMWELAGILIDEKG